MKNFAISVALLIDSVKGLKYTGDVITPGKKVNVASVHVILTLKNMALRILRSC